LRSPLNRRKALQITDHSLRKSTRSFLALPIHVQCTIVNFLDDASKQMLGSTCHAFLHYRPWHVSLSGMTAICADGSADIMLLRGECRKITASCPWHRRSELRKAEHSPQRRPRIDDLPCSACLRMRPRCDFVFKEWHNFDRRQCEACAKVASGSKMPTEVTG